MTENILDSLIDEYFQISDNTLDPNGSLTLSNLKATVEELCIVDHDELKQAGGKSDWKATSGAAKHLLLAEADQKSALSNLICGNSPQILCNADNLDRSSDSNVSHNQGFEEPLDLLYPEFTVDGFDFLEQTSSGDQSSALTCTDSSGAQTASSLLDDSFFMSMMEDPYSPVKAYNTNFGSLSGPSEDISSLSEIDNMPLSEPLDSPDTTKCSSIKSLVSMLDKTESTSRFRPLLLTNTNYDISREMRKNIIIPSYGNKDSPLISKALVSSSETDVPILSRTRFHGPLLRNGKKKDLNDCSLSQFKDASMVPGDVLLSNCISLITSTINYSHGAGYLTSLDESISDSEKSCVGKNGIKFQWPVVSNENASAIYKSDGEIRDITASWTNVQQKSDAFFRSRDKRGESFTLQELAEVVRSITSRPPRRINRYPAYQLGTNDLIGKGQSVTDWGNKESTKGHCPSRLTRVEKNWIPPDADVDVDKYPNLRGAFAMDLPSKNDKKRPDNCYDPTWVRKSGRDKEGWCDHCESGGYFLIKNSGYLYHKNHEHGIFPNGNVFEDPLIIKRKLEKESKWEGLCGICYHWIDLDHTDRKRWGTWYRHYKQCANEYEEFKKVLGAIGIPITLIEIFYRPYKEQEVFSLF